MHHSPLRYPGSKNKLAKLITQICAENNINHFVEPFAGACSVALHLLLENKVKRITINDYDKSIYAFWYCVLHHSDELCEMIKNTEITVDEWHKQKQVQKNKSIQSQNSTV